ncbi:hypothetical protein C8P68_103207 [Mucilaginibacter yixingensis]|uniref:Uncharacterized protein n=1 Tax=Mucilaginibacter yixingensis TaxID=1295612 RepID=A0A2T5JB00_9SPHI|nr:hypothetical protein C8P68_103207 [Mucilaginibacter yixingensis]
MKRIPKPILFTLIYYIVAALLGFYFGTSKSFKSGPCTPDLDIMWPLFVFLGSIVLTLIYFLKFSLKKRRINLYIALIHLAVLLGFVLLLVVDSRGTH